MSEGLVSTALPDWHVQELPTPIARPVTRVLRCSEADRTERFFSLQYVSEAFIKYSVLVLHSCIASLDEDSWRYWGYALARADSLGEWEEALAAMDTAARSAGAGGWVRDYIEWLDCRHSGRREEPWFAEAYGRVLRLCELFGALDVTYRRSPKGLLSFLVWLRNRTRGHGAYPPAKWAEANPELESLLRVFLAGC